MLINEVPCREQHGFTSGRSCLSKLLETFENWTKALDEGYGLDVAYLDYRKAFDSVPHRRLLEKLKGMGINGKLLLWLEEKTLNGRNTLTADSPSDWLRTITVCEDMKGS